MPPLQLKKPSFLKRITMFGANKRPPQLTAAEQLIQLSIRKRATAFVDARDDLETKIGRLSRRLNFLMTESDLWRDKFVTFEQYAEKLSAEANQLRAKINKEQRETKRLSGLVTLTAAEKSKLQNRELDIFVRHPRRADFTFLSIELRETESAHQDAMIELEKMKETMERMEEERAEMVAEVEAQIERALQSMAVDIDDSDYEDNSRPSSRLSSRPSSRLSNTSTTHTRTRKASEVTMRQLRSFPTDSTLTESYDSGVEGTLSSKVDRQNGTIEEGEEEEETPEHSISAAKKKRFSATQADMPQDGMTAVDEGISQKSDKIAQKVLEIQQKV
jgi:EEF1A N-terminal glycine/lysine methyltransferase